MTAKLDYTFAADALAEKTSVNASVLSALINAESSWNPNAVSPTGAKGLGQFTSATAMMYGLLGDGFDNRKDAALNLTAAVKYLADLKVNNPTWRAVIGHYSGQGPALAGYAGYSAGQALIATIDAADGVVPVPPVPPPAPPDPPAPDPSAQTIIVTATDSIGRKGTATIPLVAMMLAGVVAVGGVGVGLMFAPKPQVAAVSGTVTETPSSPAEASAPQPELAESLAALSTALPEEGQASGPVTAYDDVPHPPAAMPPRALMEMWWLKHPVGTTACGPRNKDLRWLLEPSPCVSSGSGR